MRTTELTDEQWRHLEPLLPSPRKGRGRPRADKCNTLNGILYVLGTGLPLAGRATRVWLSYNLLGELKAWEGDGTWERNWRSLLALLDELGKLEWATALLDGSFVPAKKGETG